MKRNIFLIVIVFVLAAIISYLLLEANEKQFDQTAWNNYPTERYKMSKKLIESSMLIGKSKDEVIYLLGDPESSDLQGKDHLIFALGKPPSFFESEEAKLVVVFKDTHAIKVIHSHE
jgi:hypothetical protein